VLKIILSKLLINYFGRVIPRSWEQSERFGDEETDNVGGVTLQGEDGVALVSVVGSNDTVLASGVDETLWYYINCKPLNIERIPALVQVFVSLFLH